MLFNSIFEAAGRYGTIKISGQRVTDFRGFYAHWTLGVSKRFLSCNMPMSSVAAIQEKFQSKVYAYFCPFIICTEVWVNVLYEGQKQWKNAIMSSLHKYGYKATICLASCEWHYVPLTAELQKGKHNPDNLIYHSVFTW